MERDQGQKKDLHLVSRWVEHIYLLKIVLMWPAQVSTICINPYPDKNFALKMLSDYDVCCIQLMCASG